MHDESTYFSSLSTVTGARTDTTRTTEILARPEISYIKPPFRGQIFGDAPRCKVGFDTRLQIRGTRFDFDHTTMYLSAAPGVYTNHLSAVSAFNLFENVRSLSSTYPAFSGYRIDDFHIDNPTTISVIISAAQNTGRAELILANNGGYATLFADTCARLVSFES